MSVIEAIATEAQDYLSGRSESTLVVGLTVAGEQKLVAQRSPDAQLAQVPVVDSVYEIGSVSKILTLTLFAVLEAEGKLSVDDTLGALLPQLSLRPEVAAIPLRALATHSSGLPSVGPYHLQLILEEAAGASDIPFGAYTHYLRYRKEHLYADLEAVGLDYPTGTSWQYSPIAMGTLGHLLEVVTGTSYEELLKEKLCEPLGMTDTGYTLSVDQQQRLVRAYDAEGQPRPSWYHDVLLPQGGLRSTTRDLLAFTEASIQASREPEGTPLSVALRRTRQPFLRLRTSELPAPASPPWTDEIVQGLAWRGIEQGSGLAWWHPGTTLWYHTGLAVDEHAEVGLTMLTSDPRTLTQMEQLNAMFVSWFRRAAEEA